VLAVPMYNFSVSWTLKTWMDYLARAGRTFLYTAARPEVLLKGKPAQRQALRRLNGITVCAHC
jgi:FMN-dependent NADH-azoreductase